MRIIDQSHSILRLSANILDTIEVAGRTCYKSENRMTDSSARTFVTQLMNNGHEAMLEFGYIMVKFITNRGITHEIVRHRLFSFAQESTRYVNYKNKDMEFIRPYWYDTCTPNAANEFHAYCVRSEQLYNMLLNDGLSPQEARDILPNSLKTELVVAGNPREWLHMLRLRTAKAAHPQMRDLMTACAKDLKSKVPVLFDEF